MSEIEQKVIEIFQSELEFDSIKSEDKFKEIETYDSLSAVVISSEIEDRFELKFDSDKLNKMETINEIVNFIKNNV